MNDILKKLQDGADASDENITDDDIRQLVIYYATLARDKKTDHFDKVNKAWDDMIENYPEVWERLYKMVTREPIGAKESFWIRPADFNLKFGGSE